MSKTPELDEIEKTITRYIGWDGAQREQWWAEHALYWGEDVDRSELHELFALLLDSFHLRADAQWEVLTYDSYDSEARKQLLFQLRQAQEQAKEHERVYPIDFDAISYRRDVTRQQFFALALREPEQREPFALELQRLIACDRDMQALTIKAFACQEAGDDVGEIAAWDEVIECYKRPELSSSSVYDHNLADAFNNKGVALDRLEQYELASECHREALKILRQEVFRERPAFRHKRALGLMNLSVSLLQQGFDLTAASKELAKAISILEESALGEASETYADLALAYCNSANVWYDRGDKARVPELYLRSLEMFQRDPSAGTIKNLLDRVMVSTNLGNAYFDGERWEEANDAFDQALALLNDPLLKHQSDLQDEQGRVWMYKANALDEIGGLEQARLAYEQAMRLLQDSTSIEALEDFAMLLVNYAGTLWFADIEETAVELMRRAEKIYSGDALRHWLPVSRARAMFYASAGQMLACWPQADAFARRASAALQELMELCPQAGDSDDNPHWATIRAAFDDFHQRWLLHLVFESEAHDEIPQVLAATQGRELQTAMIDEAQAALDMAEPIDTALSEYLRARRDLREAIESGENSGVLRQDLHEARAAACLVDGYAALRPDLESFHADRLTEFLAPGHALLLVMEFDDLQLLWCLDADGEMGFSECEHLAQIPNLLNKALSFRGELPTDQRGLPLRVAGGFQGLMLERSGNEVWNNLHNIMYNDFWQTVQHWVDGVHTLHICTSGSLHGLPLAAAQPPELTLCCYPGLVFFAMATGSVGSPRVRPSEQQMLLINSYEGAKDSAHGYLPGVSVEVQSVEDCLGQANASTAAALPDRAIAIARYHFAGHGTHDPSIFGSSRLVVGKNQYLSALDLLASPCHINHANLNACVVGNIDEDGRGTPLGLVTAFLRKGTASVVASTVPLADRVCLAFSQHWYRSGVVGTDVDGLDDARRLRRVQGLALLCDELTNLLDDDESITAMCAVWARRYRVSSTVEAAMADDLIAIVDAGFITPKVADAMLERMLPVLGDLACFEVLPNDVSNDWLLELYCRRVFVGQLTLSKE